MKNPKYRFCP